MSQIHRVCVTGGAGFIGSHFVDLMVREGIKVRVIDNLRTGRRAHLNPDAELFTLADVTNDRDLLYAAIDGCDWVAHFQANADVRHGLERPTFDIEQNVVGTSRLLEAMRHVGCTKIAFASTASVYGNLAMERIPEHAPFPVQASLYGASKVACEGLCSAYAEGFGFTAVIGRWVQAIGERYAHGHVIDFVRKLRRDPSKLLILGDGLQQKSGIYVKDLVEGIWTAIEHHDNGMPGSHAYNIGTDETFSVNQSAKLISMLMDCEPWFSYTGRKQGGWVGDNPRVLLDTDKIKMLGWKPDLSIPEAITRTVNWLRSDECSYL